MKIILILSLLLGITVSVSSAHTIHVPADTATIQGGISLAVDGDTVLVQPGTYLENINFSGKNIVLGSLLLTTGDTSYVSQTVIDGDRNGSVICFPPGSNTTTILSGFTINNGFGSLYDGGGIDIDGSHPVVSHMRIENNEGGNGGGIRIESSYARFDHIILRSNRTKETTGGLGGGVYVGNHASPVMKNVTIDDNHATLRGGGVCVDSGSNPSFVNVIVSGNRYPEGEEDRSGSGIAVMDYSNVTLTNVTISDHSPLTDGGIVEIERGSQATIANSILWNDSSPEISMGDHSTISVICSDIQEGMNGIIAGVNTTVNWLAGNIHQDPLFTNTTFYYLSENSPCIDSGHPDAFFYDVEDPEHPGYARWPALGSIQNDMGAYGGHGNYKSYLWNIGHIVAADLLNENVGWLSSENLVLKTEDGGLSWNSYPVEWNFHQIDFVNESVGWAIGNEGIICKSEDGGETWILQTEYSDRPLRLQAMSENVIYIAGDTDVFKTGDGGISWTTIPININITAMWFFNEEEGYVFGWTINDIIKKTYDGGRTWHRTVAPEDILGFHLTQFVDHSTGYTITTGMEEELYQTKNGGLSWAPFLSGVDLFYAVDSLLIFALQKYDDVLMKTTDGGETWENKHHDIQSTLMIQFVDASNGWIVGKNGKVLKTNDGGEIWHELNPAIITEIQIDVEKKTKQPNQFFLAQNYPNPFNPSTTIEFTLPKSEYTELKVYNILGKEVSTLVSKKLNQGNHTYTFDGKNLASGIYYYHLVAGDYKEVKKMILLR